MNSIKNIFFSTLLAMAALASGFAKAEYVSLAVSNGPVGYSASSKVSQESANKTALDMCRAEIKDNSCKLRLTKAFAVAYAEASGMAYAASEVGNEDAKKQALKLCANPGCKISYVLDKPGFWALAVAKGKGTKTQYTFGFADIESAEKLAVGACEKDSDYQCTIARSGAIPGYFTLQ